MKARAVLIGGAEDGRDFQIDTRQLRTLIWETPVPRPAVLELPGSTVEAVEPPYTTVKWKWDGGPKDSYDRYRFVRAEGS